MGNGLRDSGKPGTVMRSPDGLYVAVRIAQPAAWQVVGIRTGERKLWPIASFQAGDIYIDWEGPL